MFLVFFLLATASSYFKVSRDPAATAPRFVAQA